MKTKFDPTGKVRIALPNLSDEDIMQATGNTLNLFKANGGRFVERFLEAQRVEPEEVGGLISATGELHLHDSDVTRLPLAKAKEGAQTVWLYQHGYVGFTWTGEGEHTSEVWRSSPAVI